jgi:hypothetical protein
MGYELDGRSSNPGKGKLFLFSTASRPALEPTQPPMGSGVDIPRKTAVA